MNRLFPSLAILLAAGATAAACSSSPGSAAGASQKACALVSACAGGGGGLLDFGQTCESLGLYAGLDPSTAGSSAAPIIAAFQCVAAASDCAAAQACLTVSASVAAPCAGASTSKCSGGYAVECGQQLGGLTEALDCTGAGLTCEEDSNGAGCGTASCDVATTSPTCDGDSLVTCSDPGGALTSVSCKLNIETSCSGGSGTTSSCQTQVSNTCAVVDGTAQCVGSGPACDTTTFKNTCDGTSIVSCTGGKQGTYDCTQQSPDATCQVQSDGSATCVGTGTQCTDTTPETCADGVITYCMWGTITTVDCKAYGLSGCTTQAMSGGGTAAACTP